MTKQFQLFFIKPIRHADITLFSRQLATLLLASIPLMQAFDLIIHNNKNPSLQKLLRLIKFTIENGHSIARSLQRYPQHFSAIYCQLVAVGEQTGTLDLMLDRIASWQEKTDQLKNKIKKALFYPALVIGIATIITIALLILVIPQFINLFNSFGAALPGFTQLIINFAHFLQNYGWLLAGLSMLLIIGLPICKRKSARVARWVDYLLLRLPIIGKTIQKACIARLARTLTTTIAAGIPLNNALQIVAGAGGNYYYTQAILHARTLINKGQPLHFALKQTGKFPALVEQLVGIGETAGKLENMLAKIADIFEKEVDNTIDTLSDLLEPFIMLVLGIVIGSLVIAMYLPIFKLGNIV